MNRSVFVESPRGAVDLIEQGGHVIVEVPNCLFVGCVIDRHRLTLGRELDLPHLDQGFAHAAPVPASGDKALKKVGEQVVIGFHPVFSKWLRSVRALGLVGQAGKEHA